MKKIVLFILVSVFMFACNNDEKKAQDFLSHFEQKTLPLDFESSEFQDFFKNERVEAEFLDLLVDTTGEMQNADDGLHYKEDYFYKYYIKIDKDFDLIIMGKYPYPQPESAFEYYIYSISSETGEIIDSHILGYDYNDGFTKTTSFSEIREDFTFYTTYTDSIAEEPDDNWGYDYQIYIRNVIYKINDDGKFSLVDSNVNSSTSKPRISNEKADKLMKDVLSSDDYDYIMSVLNRYYNIETVDDFKYVFDQEEKFDKILSNMFDTYDPDMTNTWYIDVFEEYMPFISVTYGAEACCLDVVYNFYGFSEKVKITPEKDDDIFYSVLEKVYKKTDYDGKIFFGYDSDEFFYLFDGPYDYFSHMGKGNFLKAFKAIFEAKNKTSVFDDELDYIFQKLYSPILNVQNFTQSKEKVLEELNQLVDEIPFSEEQKEELNDVIEELGKFSDDV